MSENLANTGEDQAEDQTGSENMGEDFEESEEISSDFDKEDSSELDIDDSDEDKQQQQQSPVNQDAVNKRINKLTFQKYEEKRKREATEAELNKLREELESLKSPKTVVIPPMPDIYDPNYEKLMADREIAIRQKAEYDAKRELKEESYNRSIKEQAEAKRKEILDLHKGMYDKSINYGIKHEELKDHDEKVSSFIRDPNLARYILSLDDSPLVVKYLAENITELDKISSLDSVTAAGYIASTIVKKASKLKPDVTKTPTPIDIPGKRGVTEKQSKFLDGVSFE